MLWMSIFMLIGLAQSGTAAEVSDIFCKDVIKLGSNCTMVTPRLSCPTPYYTTVNLSDGVVVDNGSLTELYNYVYKYNFTNISYAGNYIAYLCDGTTRGIVVEGDEVDYGLALVIALVGAAFVCIYLANSIKHLGAWGEKQWHVDIFKSILWLFGIGFIMFAVGSMKQLLSESGVSNTLLSNSVQGATILSIRLFFLIAIVFFVLFTWKLITNVLRNKKKGKDKEEDYNEY